MQPFQSGGSSTKIELTPEAKIIADNFKANRGRYLILLKRIYFIRYGNQTHPLFNTITIQ
jgi:hypothetical protein